MFVKKLKSSITAHRMAPIKKFYFCFISKIELVIKVIDFCILVSNPLIRLNYIMVTAFNHKWSWENEVSHFCVTECATHIEIRHLPFQAIHETAFVMRVNYLSRPVAKVARADGKTIPLQHRGNTHGSFTSIAQSIKSNPVTINKRKRLHQ